MPSIGVGFAQTDSQVGVWKLNVAKSTYSPGARVERAHHHDRSRGTGVKVIVDQTMADGSTRHFEFTANYDGKDSPVTGNNPDANMVARTRVNATTVQTVKKKAGKVTTSQTSECRQTGRRGRSRQRASMPPGQKVNNIAVYDKQ